MSTLTLLAVLLWFGCSIEENYEVLSFFFDGVPDPDAVEPQQRRGSFGIGSSDTTALGAVSSHSAFVERRCSECHGRSANFGFRVSGFSELNSLVCLNCHTDVFDEYKHLHGPVAASACLQCHDPHESAYPSLLLTDESSLCLKCHRSQMTTLQQEDPIPEHADLSQNCLNCHRGHGGDHRFFLKQHESPAPSESSEPADAAVRHRSDLFGAGSPPQGRVTHRSAFTEFLLRHTDHSAPGSPDHCPPRCSHGTSDAPVVVKSFNR